MKDRLLTLKQQVQDALENEVIPFWLERAWDDTYGGFLTNFDAEGKHLGTAEKYLNTQARLIWWFSSLFKRHPQRTEFRDLAVKGVDFLMEHLWDKQYGGWAWKVNRDGSMLVNDKIVYGQSFAIYALAVYYQATGDPRGLDYATRTFDLLQIHCADTLYGGYYENLGEDWQVAPMGFAGGDRKGLDTHMHLMESFTELALASGLSLHRRKLLEVTNVIVQHMIDPQSGCGRNQFDLAFNPIPAIAIRHTWNAEREGDAPAIPTDTTSYGHNVELAWLMRRALNAAGADSTPYIPLMRRLLDHAVEHGIDWEYGGVYRDGTASGGPLILEKEFWQHAEVLVGYLDGFAECDAPVYLDAFETVWRFVNKFMINHQVGEWRTLLDRQGNPIDANIGNPWKVAYHSGRALLECLARLELLTSDSTAA